MMDILIFKETKDEGGVELFLGNCSGSHHLSVSTITSVKLEELIKKALEENEYKV
jgi:hypothetical protein